MLGRDRTECENVHAGNLANCVVESTARESAVKNIEHLMIDQRTWLRWWRWSGMLAIASRSARAESAFSKALHYIVVCCRNEKIQFGEHERQIKRLDQIDIEELSLIIESQSLPQSLRVEILRTFEQCAEMLVLRERARMRIAELSEATPRLEHYATIRNVENACSQDSTRLRMLIRSGVRLADSIASSDDSADSRDASQAMWCKSRLLIHDAMEKVLSPNGGSEAEEKRF